MENGGSAMALVKGKFADYVGATQQAEGAGKDLSDTQIASAANADYLGRQLGTLRGQFVASAGAAQLHAAQLAKASGNMQGAASNTMQLASDMLVLNDRTSSADQRIQALQDDLATLADHGFEKAQDQLSSFEANLSSYVTEMVHAKGVTLDHSGALDLMTERGRDTLSMLESSRNSMVGWAQSMADAGAPMSQITAGLQDQQSQLVTTMTKMGLTKAQAQALLSQYQLLPANIATNIHANTSQATTAVQRLQAEINAVHGKTISVQAATGTADRQLESLVARWNGRTVFIHAALTSSGSNIVAGSSGLSHATGGTVSVPALAVGGAAPSRGMALVGEQGPELISAPIGSTVYPHANVAPMLSGMSAAPTNITVTLEASGLANNLMIGAIKEAIRTGALRLRLGGDGKTLVAG